MSKAQILLCIIFPPYILIWAIQKAGEETALKKDAERQAAYERDKPKNLPDRKEDYVQHLFNKANATSMSKLSFRQAKKDIYRRAKIDERKLTRGFDKDFLGPKHVEAAAKVVSESDALTAARAFSFYGWKKDFDTHRFITLSRWEADCKLHGELYNNALAICDDPKTSEEKKQKLKSSMDTHLEKANAPQPEFVRPGYMETIGIELSFKVVDTYATQFYPGSPKLAYDLFKKNDFKFPGTVKDTAGEAERSNS